MESVKGDEMTREIVSNWFNRLGEGEKDLPLLLLDNIAYTPRTAYNEVMRGSSVGDRLQALIETGRFGTSTSDEQAIAKTRLEQIMQTKPEKPLFATLSGKTFTPSQLLEEIRSDSDVGRQWVKNEIDHMKKLMQIR